MDKIRELSLQEQSHIFAVFSHHAYSDPIDAIPLYKQIGYTTVEIFGGDSQVYVSHNEHDIIISCRGTERNLNDLMTDLDITLVNPAHGKGLVHRGFRNSVDRVWPKLSEHLKKIQASHDIWITGHSLGGGMANIIAMYLHASKELKNSTTLFTYGAPAVGDQVFVDYLTLMHVNHCRFVNNSDIVPRLLGGLYKHHSKMIFINSKGEVTGNNDLLMITSAWHLVKGLIKLSAGFIDDHKLSRYIAHLHKWAKTATKK